MRFCCSQAKRISWNQNNSQPAYNVDDVLVKELENGNYISKYLQKPIEIDLLTDIVTEIIKN